MPSPSPDPEDPSTWWRALVDAIIARQRGDKAGVVAYLQFVEAHRGRSEALRARERLNEYARHPSYADARLWPGWGYKTKEPNVTRAGAARGKAGRSKA